MGEGLTFPSFHAKMKKKKQEIRGDIMNGIELTQDIVDKVARGLGVTAEKATKLFPVLRTQYIRYSVIDSLRKGLFGIAVIAAAIFFLQLLVAFDSEFYNDDPEGTKRRIKISGTVILVIIILIFMLSAMIYVIAPDFMILKDYILR